jgi:cytochrome o ubiquinol oxidase subunit 2
MDLLNILKYISRLLSLSLFITVAVFIAGCSSLLVLNPKGQVGSGEKDLIIISALLMMLVVLPAIIMTFVFAWKFRATNKKAEYKPEWTSKKLEFINWCFPALIVITLSIIVWIDTHRLDQYHPIKSDKKPIIIQVVSLDWRWLFIYPEQKIATINQITFPVGVPIHFYITSDKVMNSFFIPQLGSQIMTMPAMQTQLFLIANRPGSYLGISSNYSGRGFSGMNFQVNATSNNEFDNWINKAKKSNKRLDFSDYEKLAIPSTDSSVTYFFPVQDNLFKTIASQNMDMSSFGYRGRSL